MAFTIEREIFSFSENDKEIVNSTRAISCAGDNRFLVCCRDYILVITMSCDLDPRCDRHSKDLPFHVSVHQIVDLAKLPAFSISDGLLDVGKTWSQASRRERQELLTDSSLYNHSTFLTSEIGGFQRAVFSPRSHSCCHNYVIAAVTSDHRVFMFEERFNEWILFTEFTAKFVKLVTSSLQLPVTIGEGAMPLTQYKKLVYSMCCVDLVWSSAFPEDGVNSDSNDPKSDTHLLFCGMRNGDLQIWQMKTCPNLNLNEFSFSFVSKHQYCSEVTSMCWHSMESNNGFLAVGYMDGNIRIFKVIRMLNADKEFHADELFLHHPSDLLSVFDMAFTQVENTNNSLVLVACKQFHLGIYSIKDSTIERVQSIHMDCSLPLVSISLHKGYGTVACQDGTIFQTTFGMKNGDITVDHTRSKVACLPNTSQVTWSCKGQVLSVNGAFCLSLHSPLTDYPVVLLGGRSSMAERQKVILSLTPGFLEDSYVFPTTPSFPRLYESSVDLTVRLLLILKDALGTNQSLDMIERVLNRLVVSAGVENLQVARAVYVFDVYKIQHSPLQFQELLFSSESRIKELTENILMTHTSNCLNWAIRNNKDLGKLSFMLQWAISCGERHQAIPDQLSLDEISDIIQFESRKYQHCFICEAKLQTFQNHLDLECVNGHPNQLCCLTFSPVAGIDSRYCLSCQAVASSPTEIQNLNLSYIRMAKDICVICGGKLS